MDSDVESDYTSFVTHHANAMWRTAYLICGDRRRAEDATQEVPPPAALEDQPVILAASSWAVSRV